MKITPFIVLLLLLAILVVFTLFCKFPFFQREGFITFLKNEDSMTEQIIPQYSDNTVYKLYDNLFFDKKNGSLIILATIINRKAWIVIHIRPIIKSEGLSNIDKTSIFIPIVATNM